MVIKQQELLVVFVVVGFLVRLFGFCDCMSNSWGLVTQGTCYKLLPPAKLLPLALRVEDACCKPGAGQGLTVLASELLLVMAGDQWDLVLICADCSGFFLCEFGGGIAVKRCDICASLK